MSRSIEWEQGSPMMNTFRHEFEDLKGKFFTSDVDQYIRTDGKSMFCEHKKRIDAQLTRSQAENFRHLDLIHRKGDPFYQGWHLIRYDKKFEYLSNELVRNTGERIWKVNKKAIFNLDGQVDLTFYQLKKFLFFALRPPELPLTLWNVEKGIYKSLFEIDHKHLIKR